MTKAIPHISKASTLDEDIPIELFLLQMTEVTSVIIPMDENGEMLSIQKWLVLNAKVGQTEHIKLSRCRVRDRDWRSYPCTEFRGSSLRRVDYLLISICNLSLSCS